jgi:hypothetical protein
MANAGHIIIKKDKETKREGRYGMGQFFKPVDKGGSKPAFCYPRRSKGLEEELSQMERNIKDDRVDPERRMAYEAKAKQLRERVDEIDASFKGAKDIIDKDPDAWKTRRENIAGEISDRMPSRDDVHKRRVNPHAVLRQDKDGGSGKRPLEELKREYTIISRAFQARGDFEEANHSFLQKDK